MGKIFKNLTQRTYEYGENETVLDIFDDNRLVAKYGIYYDTKQLYQIGCYDIMGAGPKFYDNYVLKQFPGFVVTKVKPRCANETKRRIAEEYGAPETDPPAYLVDRLEDELYDRIVTRLIKKLRS